MEKPSRIHVESRMIKSFVTYFLVISAVMIFAVLALYFTKFHGSLSTDIAIWGQSGDYIGGVLNPMLAFLSLFALCVTLLHQNAISKEEYRLAALSQFESLLFNLIHLHRECVSSLKRVRYDILSGNQVFEGRDCFVRLLQEVVGSHNSNNAETPTIDSLSRAYSIVYALHGSETHVGQYFRNLYHIFKYISDSNVLTHVERIKYAKIVRAQLSTPETALLFFNCLHTNGQRFMRYVQNYALLQELSSSDIGIDGLDQSLMEAIFGRESFYDSEG